MASVFSYLITIMGGLFWIFRVIVTTAYSLEISFPITPINVTTEIILLFVALICMIFIIKRNIFGSLVYFVCYGYYFGNDLYNEITNGAGMSLSLIISFLGVLIPFLTVMDMFLNKDRTGDVKDKKTDWYYRNEEFDRKLDERADKNQYKF